MSGQIVKRLGMAMFILAASAFVGLSFFGDVSFSERNLTEVFDAKHEKLQAELKRLPPAVPAIMASKVDSLMDAYNQTILEERGLNGELVTSIYEKLDGDPANFNADFIEKNFTGDTLIQKRIGESTEWMIGKEWTDFKQFETNLNQKIEETNSAVFNAHGIGNDGRDALIQNVMETGAAQWLRTGWWGLLIFGGAALGGLIFFSPDLRRQPGIHNNGIYHNKLQTRHYPAIILFVFLVSFYIILYHFPVYLTNQIVLLEPLSKKLSGGAANQWFLYGFMYSLSMLIMGIRMMVKYRGNQYQQVRTISVIFFQIAFAFILPQILTLMQMPAYDIKSIWPLEYSFFFDYRVDQMLEAGTFGIFLLIWGTALFMIGVPVLTYFYGKRWYCSWVCGCGGLAETVGDPWRQLSDKRLGAWKIERWLVHSVLVFAVVMTIAVLYTTVSGEAQMIGINSYDVRYAYGFFIGFVFAGAVGTGFYPVMGNRVWCRFGCPLAAYLGIVQRFKSRFRITTNGGQCISCGNCSTYCEMGIDVRWYAQRGQNIVRSSCVGCGVCSAVCPRGVLKLENKSLGGRINENPIIIGREGVTLNV